MTIRATTTDRLTAMTKGYPQAQWKFRHLQIHPVPSGDQRQW